MEGSGIERTSTTMMKQAVEDKAIDQPSIVATITLINEGRMQQKMDEELDIKDLVTRIVEGESIENNHNILDGRRRESNVQSRSQPLLHQ